MANEAGQQALQTDAQATQSLYSSLAVAPTSIRLLRIKPAENFDDPISCEIFVAHYKEQREFQALSYKWGSDDAKQCIRLNDVVVEVGQNLSDALHYLRSRKSEKERYWIDALCINQRDVAERNQQVGGMRFIYSRATTVLIWLGKKYERYGEIIPTLETIPKAKAKPKNKTSNGIPEPGIQDKDLQPRADEDEIKGEMLARELYNDEYWNRVWIVQEICLAGQLEVCLGRVSTNWIVFINLMALHNLGNAGPMKLNKQIQAKELDSYKLLDLVEDYQNARCTDQRDKIYGLVGLARDVHEFPIDYRKSLYDIWKDVMEAAKAAGMLEGRDIIATGRLVKFTLMGSKGYPLENLLRQYVPKPEEKVIIDKPGSNKAFKIPGTVIGCVQYVGPRIEDIVADPRYQEAWEYRVQTNYQTVATSAHNESEKLLRAIVDPNGPDVSRLCFSYTSTVRWTAVRYSNEDNYVPGYVLEKVQHLQSRDFTKGEPADATTQSETQTGNIRLYQLHGFRGGNNWRFGIASPQVQLGDLICWVGSTSRALVIRLIPNDPPVFQAIGTAITAADIRGSSKEKHANRLACFRGQFKLKDITTYIDSTLIFILLGGGSADNIF